MNEQQYAYLIITLSAVGQASNAFDQLDNDELENLMFLLQEALMAVARENGRRQEEHPQ